jgi:hypothetical protein
MFLVLALAFCQAEVRIVSECQLAEDCCGQSNISDLATESFSLLRMNEIKSRPIVLKFQSGQMTPLNHCSDVRRSLLVHKFKKLR